jgi:glycine/D-amino acid oxidase-like deaminating enzyme
MSRDGNPAPTIIVIGAGMAGIMSAFHLKSRIPRAKITLIEKGNRVPYRFATSCKSAACSRQQWDLRINVAMSLFSTRFYENFGQTLADNAKIFWQRGYLFLYRHPEKWEAAQRRVTNQQLWGLTEVRGLSADEVKHEFSFAYTDQLLGATFCPTDGFLDAGTIMTILRDKLLAEGVKFRTRTEAISFKSAGQRISGVQVKTDDVLEDLPCDYVVNCTGPWAARLGNRLGTPLPVAPQKRYLWSAEFANSRDNFPQAEYDKMPFIVCTANHMVPYIKPQPVVGGNSFTVGCEHEVEPSFDFEDTDQEKVDPGYEVAIPGGYHQRVWETLADWLPFTERLGFRSKVEGGFYETTFDKRGPVNSPIIGFDPIYNNVIHCVGFSGHGIMHGPAAGATVADLISSGEYLEFPDGEQYLSYHSLINGMRPVEDMKI